MHMYTHIEQQVECAIQLLRETVKLFCLNYSDHHLPLPPWIFGFVFCLLGFFFFFFCIYKHNITFSQPSGLFYNVRMIVVSAGRGMVFSNC